jgi:hypothetical protein
MLCDRPQCGSAVGPGALVDLGSKARPALRVVYGALKGRRRRSGAASAFRGPLLGSIRAYFHSR